MTVGVPRKAPFVTHDEPTGAFGLFRSGPGFVLYLMQQPATAAPAAQCRPLGKFRLRRRLLLTARLGFVHRAGVRGDDHHLGL